jgi:hypothetical protein
MKKNTLTVFIRNSFEMGYTNPVQKWLLAMERVSTQRSLRDWSNDSSMRRETGKL